MAVSSKAGIGTGDYILQITLIRDKFMEIPNVLICRGRNILVIVDGRRPHYWSYGVAEHLTKMCLMKNPVPPPPPPSIAAAKVAVPATTKEAVRVQKSGQNPSGLSEWMEVVRRRKKLATLPPQQDVPLKGASSSKKSAK